MTLGSRLPEDQRDRLGIAVADGIHHHLRLLPGAGLQVLEDLGDRLVIRRAGPGEDGSRLRVGSELGVRDLLFEIADDRARVRVGHGVDHQLFLHRTRTARSPGIERLDRRLDLFLLGGRGPDHDLAPALVERTLRVGEEVLENGHHALRVRRPDRIDGQLELPARGAVAIELIEDFRDRHVLRGLGPDRKLARLRVLEHLDARKLRLQ